MNMPRQSTKFPRWLVLAVGLAAMMSGTGAMAGEHETVPPEQREELQKRAQQESEAKKPDRESWASGMSRQQEERERMEQQEAERAAKKAREQAAKDPQALAEEAEKSGDVKPEESWVSGLPVRGQEWEPEDTEKIDESAAERAARQRAARQEEGATTDRGAVPDETVEQIIETRRDGAAGSGPAEEEAENDEEDTDGPPDGS